MAIPAVKPDFQRAQLSFDELRFTFGAHRLSFDSRADWPEKVHIEVDGVPVGFAFEQDDESEVSLYDESFTKRT